MIVFVSDNGWLQGEHRIPGDKFLPYEESLRVPLVIRGPGVPQGRTVHGQVSNIDFAPTLVDVAGAKPGRTMDGVSLLPTIRNPKRRPDAIEIEALAPLFAADDPRQRLGSALHGRAHRPLHLRGLDRDRREGALRPQDGPVRAREPRRRPRLRVGRGEPGGEARRSSSIAPGKACTGSREDARRAAVVLAVVVLAGARRRRAAARKQGTAPPRRPLLRDLRAQGRAPGRQGDRLEHDRPQRLPGRVVGATSTRTSSPSRTATPLVIKNGPRHFLMDSATAKTGRRQVLPGRARRATSRRSRSATAADLATTPYTERTIKRLNTWHWKKGRKVFELLAPDGSDYVMQSYSQIIDPEQKITDLPSLGERLELPQGWSYTVEPLKQPLTLNAEGSATILQDDLQNTYQRLPRHRDAQEPRRRDDGGDSHHRHRRSPA